MIIPHTPFDSSFINDHNQEIKTAWDAYKARKPYRVPIIFGLATRFFIFNPATNPRNISFKEYSTQPDTMFDMQLQFQDWSRHNILQDTELGLPEAWSVYVDFQNYYEAGWFGAEIKYHKEQVPESLPFLNEDNKRTLLDRGIPDPFKDGLMRRLREYHDYFCETAADCLYKGRPVKVSPPSGALGTDGPLTVAINLRGPDFLTDFYEDPDYVHDVMALITEAIIRRIKAWRLYLNLPEKPTEFGIADDSVEMISTDQYKEFVLPYHKKIFNECSLPGPRMLHLCGNAYRHFPMMVNELKISMFDTGFPIDFKWIRENLGPEIDIQGGPRITTLALGTPEEVEKETTEILQSGIMAGGRFILREGNNLAPHTPMANMLAMYQTGRKLGTYA
jgi:uroporphyrinogen-III decarboxylase